MYLVINEDDNRLEHLHINSVDPNNAYDLLVFSVDPKIPACQADYEIRKYIVVLIIIPIGGISVATSSYKDVLQDHRNFGNYNMSKQR